MNTEPPIARFVKWSINRGGPVMPSVPRRLMLDQTDDG